MEKLAKNAINFHQTSPDFQVWRQEWLRFQTAEETAATGKKLNVPSSLIITCEKSALNSLLASCEAVRTSAGQSATHLIFRKPKQVVVGWSTCRGLAILFKYCLKLHVEAIIQFSKSAEKKTLRHTCCTSGPTEVCG